MTSQNISVVIGPNLVWHKNTLTTLSDIHNINSFCQYLIDNPSFVQREGTEMEFCDSVAVSHEQPVLQVDNCEDKISPQNISYLNANNNQIADPSWTYLKDAAC